MFSERDQLRLCQVVLALVKKLMDMGNYHHAEECCGVIQEFIVKANWSMTYKEKFDQIYAQLLYSKKEDIYIPLDVPEISVFSTYHKTSIISISKLYTLSTTTPEHISFKAEQYSNQAFLYRLYQEQAASNSTDKLNKLIIIIRAIVKNLEKSTDNGRYTEMRDLYRFILLPALTGSSARDVHAKIKNDYSKAIKRQVKWYKALQSNQAVDNLLKNLRLIKRL